MKSLQRGDSMLSLLASLAMCLGFLFWWLSDFAPAEAEDLNAVIALAERNAEAKATLLASLTEEPNPDRSQLRRLRGRINEIIVTETARSVTGDRSLETRTARAEARQKEDAVRRAAIEAKAWGALSGPERAEYLAGKWHVAAAMLLLLGGGVYVWRTWFRD